MLNHMRFYMISGFIAGVLGIPPFILMIKGLTMVRQIGFLGMIIATLGLMGMLGAIVFSLYFCYKHMRINKEFQCERE